MNAETWNELEERGEEKRVPERLRPPDPAVANLLLALGGAVILFVYAYSFAETMPQPTFSGALFAGGMLSLGGFLVKGDDRIIKRGIEHQKALERQHKHIEEEAGLRNTQLAAVVEQNNLLMRQLQAMPTVRLQEVRDELRATREYADTVAEGAVKRLAERIDEIVEMIERLADRPIGPLTEAEAQLAAMTAKVDQVVVDIAEMKQRSEAFDAQYMVDMSKAVQLGREIERRDEPPTI